MQHCSSCTTETTKEQLPSPSLGQWQGWQEAGPGSGARALSQRGQVFCLASPQLLGPEVGFSVIIE